jgi:hypothetical protein
VRNEHGVAIRRGNSGFARNRDEKNVKKVAIPNLADLEQLTAHVGIGRVAIPT